MDAPDEPLPELTKEEFREVARILRPDWEDWRFDNFWSEMIRTREDRKFAYEHRN